MSIYTTILIYLLVDSILCPQTSFGRDVDGLWGDNREYATVGVVDVVGSVFASVARLRRIQVQRLSPHVSNISKLMS
jgi:hypothetical protein